MAHRLIHCALAALFVTNVLSTPLSARELADIAEGEAFGFELHDVAFPNGTVSRKWEPSQALLDDQQARMENFYILDPVTNTTILNPANDIALAKRNNFNPYNGAECRMVFMHHYNIRQCCGGQHCEDCSEETTQFRILDHKNSGTNFAVFDMDPGNWEYYQLNGHRGWWGIANWNWNQWYAIEAAFGHIEGQSPDRNMKWDDYCWYSQGSAWWGYYGEAACTSWCSSFNW